MNEHNRTPKETRSGKYARFLAFWIEKTLIHLRPYGRKPRGDYLNRFLNELQNFSFEGRYKGESRNAGCIKELERIVSPDLGNPEVFAKIIKEGLHLMYQKDTQKRILNGLVDKLKDFKF